MLIYGTIYMLACGYTHIWGDLLMCLCVGMLMYWVCVCVYLCMSGILTLPPIPSSQGLFLILGLVFFSTQLEAYKPQWSYLCPCQAGVTGMHLSPGLLHWYWDQNSGPQDFVVSTYNLWATSPAPHSFQQFCKDPLNRKTTAFLTKETLSGSLLLVPWAQSCISKAWVQRFVEMSAKMSRALQSWRRHFYIRLSAFTCPLSSLNISPVFYRHHVLTHSGFIFSWHHLLLCPTIIEPVCTSGSTLLF